MNFYFRYSSSTFGCSALLLCNGGSMGGGPGGWPTPTLVSDPSEVRRAEKCFWDTPPPTIVRPPFLKVWICHCCVQKRNSFYLTINLNLLSNVRCVVHLYMLTSESPPCKNCFASGGWGSLPLLGRHFLVLACKAKYGKIHIPVMRCSRAVESGNSHEWFD